MVSFGLSNCFWDKPVKTTSPIRLIVLRSFFTSACFLLLAVLIENRVVKLPFHQLIFLKEIYYFDVIKAIALCFVNFWGLFFFLKSMQHADSRVSISIGSAGTLIFILIGVVFYNERPTHTSYVYMVVFTIGWWFIENLSKEVWKLKWSRGVSFALLCMVFWRSAAFFPMAIGNVGVLYFSLILELTVFITSFFLLMIEDRTFIPHLPVQDLFKHKYNIFALVLFGFMGVLFLNMAMVGTSLYSFAIIGMLQPLTSIIVGSFIFRTQLTFYQKIGIGILLFGMAVQMVIN